jgi:hypothetical protein
VAMRTQAHGKRRRTVSVLDPDGRLPREGKRGINYVQ